PRRQPGAHQVAGLETRAVQRLTQGDDRADPAAAGRSRGVGSAGLLPDGASIALTIGRSPGREVDIAGAVAAGTLVLALPALERAIAAGPGNCFQYPPRRAIAGFTEGGVERSGRYLANPSDDQRARIRAVA